MKENKCYWYIKQVITEEVLCRVTILGILAYYINDWLAIIISSIIYGLLHFILFKWQMVIASFMFGIPVGLVYCWYLNVFGFNPVSVVAAIVIVCIIHFVGGWLCDTVGWTIKWKRDKTNI